MSREVHVRFCERPEVKFLRSTHPYIPMARGFVYLAVVLDWFSRRVLSWRISITMEAAFCVETLEDALAPRQAGDLQHGSGQSVHRHGIH
jgi:transposase InsO family protein